MLNKYEDFERGLVKSCELCAKQMHIDDEDSVFWEAVYDDLSDSFYWFCSKCR